MADENQLKILKQGVATWNDWRSKLVPLGIRLNPSRANLGGVHLSRPDLSHANLGQADLTAGKLSGARLVEADLSGANVRQTNLSGVAFDRAFFFGVPRPVAPGPLLFDVFSRQISKIRTLSLPVRTDDRVGPRDHGLDWLSSSPWQNESTLCPGPKKSLPRSAAFSRFGSTGLTPWKKTSDVNGPEMVRLYVALFSRLSGRRSLRVRRKAQHAEARGRAMPVVGDTANVVMSVELAGHGIWWCGAVAKYRNYPLGGDVPGLLIYAADCAAKMMAATDLRR
ncbi:MAG: pentapeptide repeat-containing protein [Rhodopila sp.]|jgi:hypothetical protein